MFQLSVEQSEELVGSVAPLVQDKTLLLVRGIPGLGKSTLARAMSERFGAVQIENDMQFMVSGEYMFDPVKLEDAHMSTQLEVRNLLSEDAPCVVVSNTFTRAWEMAAYQLLASKFGYTLVIVDLLLCVRLNAQKANLYFNANQFLDFLSTVNVHMVPPDKIRSMYDRYEYSNDVISVAAPADLNQQESSINFDYGGPASNVLTLNHRKCDYKLLDTGYYLALDLAVPEDVHDVHSGIYQHCIAASQQILHVFGVNCGYRMLRKLTLRNARSHGMAYAVKQQEAMTGQVCTNPHANARNALKLAAGWTRYHLTLLSPSEYTDLKKRDCLGQFLMFLYEIDFAPLMQATSQAATLPGDTVGAAGSAGTTDSPVSLGMQQGPITENAAFPLDDMGELAGLSRGAYSTALYLRLNPAIPTLQALSELRVQFGCHGTVGGLSTDTTGATVTTVAADSTTAEAAVQAESWQPHITLAFTHNDIRTDPTNPATTDKLQGVHRFRELAANLGLTDAHSADPGHTTALLGQKQEAQAVTDLVADAPTPSLATMLLHTETQASFRADHFGFTVVDVKVRRGPMGDDATYRAHPFLQGYLPRGLVYLQHQSSRVIYRGLFSLRKFYGKEGAEDDGIGIGASQLNFKLKKILQETSTILVMEKVNGRAASCRFFTYAAVLYVLVGTKLSHVICRVDVEGQRLVMPALGASQAGSGVAESGDDGAPETDGGESGGELSRQSPAPESAGGESTAAAQAPVDLILSNVTALQSNLRWERLNDFVRWLDGRTFNGEVLDPREMHLVVLTRHEWVSLCVTQFVAALCGGATRSVTAKAGAAAVAAAASGSAGVESEDVADVSAQSALQDMYRLGEFTHCVPAYESHSTDKAVSPEETTNVENTGTTLQHKQALLQQITQAVVHARDSEGKVLYFLDATGRVLELLKFKTWWYIWRRSCRELVSSLFSRFYSASNAGKGANKRQLEQDTAEGERLAGETRSLCINCAQLYAW
jgi:hypothetical protein